MLSKEFLIEYRDAKNPERYVYGSVDFLREPHFITNLKRGGEFMDMTVESAKPLVDKMATIRKQLRNMLSEGDELYVLDFKLNYSILIERAYNQPNISTGKNAYFLISIMAPSIHGEFIMPSDTRIGGGPLAPRFDINTRKIIE